MAAVDNLRPRFAVTNRYFPKNVAPDVGATIRPESRALYRRLDTDHLAVIEGKLPA